MIVFSIGTGFWMAARAMDPWTGLYSDIRRLQREKPKYFELSSRESHLYGIIQSACYNIEHKNLPAAARDIATGQSADPQNPTWDYLQAAVCERQGDARSALAHIDRGNTKGPIRIYATKNSPADQWSWPEINLICHCGKKLTRADSTPKSVLVPVIKMGDHIMGCEPSDSTILLQGVNLRQSISRKLFKIAAEEHDGRLAKVCTELVDETQRLTKGIHRYLSHSSAGKGDNQALVFARTTGYTNRPLRNAAMLLYRERHAEWTGKLRDKCLRYKLIGELD